MSWGQFGLFFHHYTCAGPLALSWKNQLVPTSCLMWALDPHLGCFSLLFSWVDRELIQDLVWVLFVVRFLWSRINESPNRPPSHIQKQKPEIIECIPNLSLRLRLRVGLRIFPQITNNFADYEKIAGITNYFGVEFLKISFYLILFVKIKFFRQKERIQVIKYIYLFKKKKIKMEMEMEME